MPPKSRKNLHPVALDTIPSSSSSTLSFPRAVSPSGSISQFFNAPKKWFSRSPSPRSASTSSTQASSVPPSSYEEPRPSNSSGWSRKHTISGPSDPRPIRPSELGKLATLPPPSLDLATKEASTPPRPSNDLRGISNRPYSRSVDDLTRALADPTPTPEQDQKRSQTQERIQRYRNASVGSSLSSPISADRTDLSQYPFPKMPLSTSPKQQSVFSSSTPPPPLPPTPHTPNSRTVPTISITNTGLPHKRSHSANLLATASPAPIIQPSSSMGNRTPTQGLLKQSFGPPPPPPPPVHELPVPKLSTEPPRDSANQDSKAQNRSSQIIHIQGFVNRLPSFTAAPLALSNPRLGPNQSTSLFPPVVTSRPLPKGWKPFKVILKGSKLYFYKPPSSSVASGIKDLFATSLTNVTDDEPVEQQQASPAVFDFKPPVPQRRLYWGHGRHPELIPKIDKDTPAEDRAKIEKGTGDALVHETVFGTSFDGPEPSEEWKPFARAMLLTLPLSLVLGRDKFKAEYDRCRGYYLHGIPDELLDSANQRLAWLDETYGSLWKAENPVSGGPNASRPRSSSVNDVLDKSDPAGFSPPIGGLEHTVFPSVASSLAPPPGLSPKRKIALTTDFLLQTNERILAKCLAYLHGRDAEVLQRLSNGEILSMMLDPSTQEGTAFLAVVSTHGSEERPHWLTRVVLNSLIDISEGEARTKTHGRGMLLMKWIATGEQCRLRGDEVSWRAIFTALICPAIARLEKTWRRVGDETEDTMRKWLDNPECASNQSAWITNQLLEALQAIKKEDRSDPNIPVRPLIQLAEAVESFSAKLTACTPHVSPNLPEDCLRLVEAFDHFRAEVPSVQVNYMAKSLQVEPRNRSHYEPHFFTRTYLPSTQALMPLVFPQPLPTCTLIDRQQLLNGRRDPWNPNNQNAQIINDEQVKNLVALKNNVRSRRSVPSGMRMSSISETGGYSHNAKLPDPVISVKDGDLLLIVQSAFSPSSSSSSTSRPSSMVSTRPQSMASEAEIGVARAPSVRVKPRNTAPVERKTSLARRSSLPSITQRPAPEAPVERVDTNEAPLKAIVKAGTLDCLIDLLVSGIEDMTLSFADDHGEVPLSFRSRLVRVDRSDFDATWWNVFRSFLTPVVFFDLLRKRYILAKSIRRQIDVLSTLTRWVVEGGGNQDILDDPELLKSVYSFIRDSMEGLSGDFEDPKYQALLKFKQTLEKELPRPWQASGWVDEEPSSSDLRFTASIPDIDSMSPRDFVECINTLIPSGAPLADFLVASDILEVQTLDKLGWFISRDPSTIGEEVEVQSLAELIQEVTASELLGDHSAGNSLYKILPPSIRCFIRPLSIVKKWITYLIVEPDIGFARRQARMKFILACIELCRPAPNAGAPGITSFVEAALTAAVLSPASRAFHRAWLGIAQERGCAIDSFESFFATGTTAERASGLRVDVGWVLERLMEVLCMPDTFDFGTGAPTLINFSKRRYLCDIARTVPLKVQQEGYNRLSEIHSKVAKMQIDFRSVMHDAVRENGQGWAQMQRRTPKPFHKLIVAQQERLKRDRHMRDRMVKECRADMHRNREREQMMERVQPRKAPVQFDNKPQRNKRTMSSAFLRVMRPLSTAFSSTENLHSPGHRPTVFELDFAPSGNPAMVISVVDAKIAVYMNLERPYTFQLDTEDGGLYLLQATTKGEMTQWLALISKVAQQSASKRRTFTDNLKPEPSDHVGVRPRTITRHPVAVFGVNLDFLLKRENNSEDIPPDVIPRILDKCLTEVERRGLQEVGIYRIGGQTSVINALKEAFDSGHDVSLTADPYLDINAVCDIIKSYLRALPDSVIPERMYWDFIDAMKIPELEARLAQLRRLIQDMPDSNFYLLRRLMEHLERVTDYEEHNQMTATSLAIVIAPNLIRAPGDNFAVALGNMSHTTSLVKTLISHVHSVFNETDGDHEEEEVEAAAVEQEEQEVAAPAEEESSDSEKNYIQGDSEALHNNNGLDSSS